MSTPSVSSCSAMQSCESIFSDSTSVTNQGHCTEDSDQSNLSRLEESFASLRVGQRRKLRDRKRPVIVSSPDLTDDQLMLKCKVTVQKLKDSLIRNHTKASDMNDISHSFDNSQSLFSPVQERLSCLRPKTSSIDYKQMNSIGFSKDREISGCSNDSEPLDDSSEWESAVSEVEEDLSAIEEDSGQSESSITEENSISSSSIPNTSPSIIIDNSIDCSRYQLSSSQNQHISESENENTVEEDLDEQNTSENDSDNETDTNQRSNLSLSEKLTPEEISISLLEDSNFEDGSPVRYLINSPLKEEDIKEEDEEEVVDLSTDEEDTVEEEDDEENVSNSLNSNETENESGVEKSILDQSFKTPARNVSKSFVVSI